MLIIGSHAIKYWFLDFPREPKDLDVIVASPDERLDLRSNYKRVERLINPVLLEHHKANKYATPDELYTLKISHLFWDINWEKHMFDVQFLGDKGAKLIYPLFYKLYEYWNTVHPKNSRSNLNMSADDFFDNAVNCEYDHDWLHTLINDPPMFTKVLRDEAEVEVSSDKFHSLAEVDKEALVREEVYIMAFERFGNLPFRRAYELMLKKFIISHAPLWEAIWIIENYKKLHRVSFDFIKHLNKQINERGTDKVIRSARIVSE